MFGSAQPQFPRMLTLRQRLHSDPLDDPRARLDEGLGRSRTLELLGEPGSRIAVAVGSRYIDSLPEVIDQLFARLRAAGHHPFLLPAMGSHGGATPEGQVQILRDIGLATAGREVRSSMETVFLGRTPGGAEVFTARDALEADAVVVVNRVAPHTGYVGVVQSGLVKMLSVGLGKDRGATAAHRHGFGAGAILGEMADAVLERLNVVAGVALVEDGNKALSRLEVLPPDRIRSREPHLLDEAFSMFPRIPVHEADLLIVDEMGKNICGTGMHPLVIGRGKRPEPRAEPVFTCRRLAVLGLTPASRGNATGIGFADVATERLLSAVDKEVTRRNVLASGSPERARLPLAAENDRQAVRLALQSLGGIPPDRVRVVRIKNTSELSEIKVSTAVPETLNMEGIELGSEAEEMSFDADGRLR